MSAILTLKTDGASISPERAKSLSPKALGEALLADADSQVVEATVGPQGMEPPLPPGEPVRTRIKLYLQPTPAAEPGFCQQLVATIILKPVKPMQDGTASSWRREDIFTDVAYRWVGGSPQDALTCSAPRTRFFTPEPREAKQTLQVVRLVASASAAARDGRSPRFPVSVEDQLGPEMLNYQQKHPELSPIRGLRIIRDPREALAALPVDTISFAGPASRAYPGILQASDLKTSDKRPVEPMTLFMGGQWTVGLVLYEGQITRMRLRRAIPAPF